jgi:hypothetical protein
MPPSLRGVLLRRTTKQSHGKGVGWSRCSNHCVASWQNVVRGFRRLRTGADSVPTLVLSTRDSSLALHFVKGQRRMTQSEGTSQNTGSLKSIAVFGVNFGLFKAWGWACLVPLDLEWPRCLQPLFHRPAVDALAGHLCSYSVGDPANPPLWLAGHNQQGPL